MLPPHIPLSSLPEIELPELTLAPLASQVDGRQGLATGAGPGGMAFTRLLQSVHRRLTARLDDEPMRLLIRLAVIITALSLAGTAGAGTRELTIDRGIVQSVSPTRIVLRELDGNTVAIAVSAETTVLVNGLPATVLDIQPGFVAAVTHRGRNPAVLIRAFGRIQPIVDRGIVLSASPRAVVIRTVDGSSLTFRVTLRTRIRWRGLPATMAAVRPGRVVEVAHTRAGVAIRIAVRARRAL